MCATTTNTKKEKVLHQLNEHSFSTRSKIIIKMYSGVKMVKMYPNQPSLKTNMLFISSFIRLPKKR